MRHIFLPFAAAALLAACSGGPPPHQMQPLAIEQPAADKQLAAKSNLAVVGGRLAIYRDGETRLPYPEGTDAGCVAGTTAALLILVPLAILAGGVPFFGGGGCEDYLPKMILVHLESERTAALVVPSDGLFFAQLPSGTYLVAAITDDKLLLPVRMAFQAAEPGHGYNLGGLSVSYDVSFWTGSENFKLNTAPDSGTVDAGIVRVAAGKPLPRHVQTPLRLSSPVQVRAGAAPYFYFPNTASWNAYVASAVAELHGQGMELIPGAAYAGMLPGDKEAEFIERRRAAEQKWAAAIAGIEQEQCQPDMAPDRCKAAVATAEAGRDAELKAIAAERATAALAADRVRKREDVAREWAARIDTVKRQYCLPPDQYSERCNQHLAKAEAERDAALAALD